MDDHDEQAGIVRDLFKVSPWQLADMLKKYPSLTTSWEAFIINYNICLSNEEYNDNSF